MTVELCSVTIDLNRYQSNQYDCNCADGVEPDDIQNLCTTCFHSHPDTHE